MHDGKVNAIFPDAHVESIETHCGNKYENYTEVRNPYKMVLLDTYTFYFDR